MKPNNYTTTQEQHLDGLIQRTQTEIFDLRIKLDAYYTARDAKCDITRNYIQDEN